MPRLSFFYGIAIYLYYEDHPPPHIAATKPEVIGYFRSRPALLRLKAAIRSQDLNEADRLITELVPESVRT